MNDGYEITNRIELLEIDVDGSDNWERIVRDELDYIECGGFTGGNTALELLDDNEKDIRLQEQGLVLLRRACHYDGPGGVRTMNWDSRKLTRFETMYRGSLN